jgi:hypothetical protein
MHPVSRPAGLLVVALAIPLLLGDCKSSEAPNVATTIVITPPTATLAAIGRTQPFTAVVKDQHGGTMTGAVVTWASVNAAVVTVVSTTGVATAVANGSTQVTATSGSATQNANVTVAQVPLQITKVSGDAQSGTVGQAVTQPLIVEVDDSTAHPINGATVTFAVTTGTGSLGTATPTTNAAGQAQTTWTLGTTAGSQAVSASAGGGSTPVSFTATAGPGAAASVAKQSGDAQSTTTGATLPTAPAVILKDAFNNARPGVAVTFSVAAGNGAITGASQTTNASGVATVGSWALGDVGTNTLTATVTGTGIAGNPVNFTATSLSAGAPANVALVVGNNQPGLGGYGVNVRPAVLVTNASSNPVPNATVTFAVASGGGSVTGGVATTNANGVAQVGKWTLGASAGVNTLTATVTGLAGNPVTFSDTALAPGYTIEVRNVGPALRPEVQAALDSAVAKWQRLIYRPIGPTMLTALAGQCGSGSPAVAEVVPNLLIFARFDSIDGPGKILGQAGPCFIQVGGAHNFTILGQMTFDSADVGTMIAQGSLKPVMLHEMGHVIGFGTLWGPPSPQIIANCIQLPSSAGNVRDTYFSCPKGRAAFDSAGGTSYTGASLSPPGGNKVPVENCGASTIALVGAGNCGASTANGHWSEPVFGNELMTGYIDIGAPLSVVTVAAQEDLGYAVNYDAADPYVHVFTVRAAGGAAPLFLGDDIWRGPLHLVDRTGRVIGVINR